LLFISNIIYIGCNVFENLKQVNFGCKRVRLVVGGWLAGWLRRARVNDAGRQNKKIKNRIQVLLFYFLHEKFK
jgi:hypothetical protein